MAIKVGIINPGLKEGQDISKVATIIEVENLDLEKIYELIGRDCNLFGAFGQTVDGKPLSILYDDNLPEDAWTTYPLTKHKDWVQDVCGTLLVTGKPKNGKETSVDEKAFKAFVANCRFSGNVTPPSNVKLPSAESLENTVFLSKT